MGILDRMGELETSETAEWAWPEIAGVTLTVRQATENNRPFMSAMFKRTKANAKELRKGGSVDMLADDRNQDRELYARHIVAGWSGVTRGPQNEPVPLSFKNCMEFFELLPDDLFDRLRVFCGQQGNFRSSSGIDEAEVEEAEGN